MVCLMGIEEIPALTKRGCSFVHLIWLIPICQWVSVCSSICGSGEEIDYFPDHQETKWILLWPAYLSPRSVWESEGTDSPVDGNRFHHPLEMNFPMLMKWNWFNFEPISSKGGLGGRFFPRTEVPFCTQMSGNKAVKCMLYNGLGVYVTNRSTCSCYSWVAQDGYFIPLLKINFLYHLLI